MADELETEEETTEYEAADGTETDDGGDSAGAGEGDEEPEKPAEPFLKVDDRTVYSDRESALKGWGELNGHLSKYRKLGKPEEIERRLTEAKAREDLIDTLKLGSKSEQVKAEEKYLDTLAPEKRQAWLASRKPIQELLSDELGKIGKLEQQIAEINKSRETDKSERQAEKLQGFRRRALGDLDRLLTENGKTLTDKQRRRLEDLALATMQREDDEDGQELLQALNAEDTTKFATVAARIYLGEEAIKPSQNGSRNGAGDDRPRDPTTGQFLSEEQIAARKKAAAANKASRLAKAPPEGGAAGTEAGGKKDKPTPIASRAGRFADKLGELLGAG